MNQRLKAAFFAHLVVVLGVFGMGMVYAFTPKLMPYHQRAIQVPFESLPDSVQTMFFVLMRGAGLGMITAAGAVAILLLIPFRRGERWAHHAVAVLELIGTAPLVALMFWLDNKTVAAPPIFAGITALGLVFVGWWLSLDFRAINE